MWKCNVRKKSESFFQLFFWNFYIKIPCYDSVLKDMKIFSHVNKSAQKTFFWMKKLRYVETRIEKVFKNFEFFLYSVQWVWCERQRKFDANLSIFKPSKNQQRRTSVHWCVGLKGLKWYIIKVLFLFVSKWFEKELHMFKDLSYCMACKHLQFSLHDLHNFKSKNTSSMFHICMQKWKYLWLEWPSPMESDLSASCSQPHPQDLSLKADFTFRSCCYM